MVSPLYDGIQGHSLGFGAKNQDQLVCLTGDSGACIILQNNKNALYLM
jgi:CTP:molybdopterin cytidylyltransferase MocA